MVGVMKPNCKRIPLKISLNTAPVLASVYCILAFMLLVEKSSIMRYLQEKNTQLYLSEEDINFIVTKSHSILFGLALVEVLRFYLIRKLKNELEGFDEDQRRAMLENHGRVSASANRRSWSTNTNPNHSDREALSTPLLSDQGENHDGDGNWMSPQRHQSSNRSSASWWEDPDDDDTNHQSSSLDVSANTSGGGGWMSRVFPSSASASASASKHKGDRGEDGSASVSSSGFAPIDDEMETGATSWHQHDDGGDEKPTYATTASGSGGATPFSWHRDDDIPKIDNGKEPDTSWAHE